MTNTNIPQPSVNEPKRENFKNDVEFDLARINYFYQTKEPNHPMFKIIKSMEANLLYKSALGITE